MSLHAALCPVVILPACTASLPLLPPNDTVSMSLDLIFDHVHGLCAERHGAYLAKKLRGLLQPSVRGIPALFSSGKSLTAFQEQTSRLTYTSILYHIYSSGIATLCSYLSECIYSSCRSCRHCISLKAVLSYCCLVTTYPRLGVSEYKAVTSLSAQMTVPLSTSWRIT
jgi:hypothetical protein